MRIALFDYSHALSVNFHARANDGGPNYAAEATMGELAQLKGDYDRIIVCYDSKPYFRSEIYPAYKAQREQAAPELLRLWRTCSKMVEGEYQIARAPGFEADDCAATLAHAYAAMGHTVEICTADKDILQCVRDSELNKRDGTLTGPISRRYGDKIAGTEFVRTKYGVEPQQFALMLAIMGDKSDNIPGIPGIGEKGASKLITQFAPADHRFDLQRVIMAMRVALSEAVTAARDSGKELPSFWKKFAAAHIAGEGVPGLELMLRLTTLRTDAPLDAAALLEKKPHPSMAHDATEPDEEREPDWDAIAERDSLEMAAMSANDDDGAALKKALDDFDGMVAPSPNAEPKEATYAPALKGVQPESVATTKPNGDSPSSPAEPKGAGRESAVTGLPGENARDPAPQGAQIVPRAPEPTQIVTAPRLPAPSWELQLQPQSASEALQIAKHLWSSGRYRQHESPAGIAAVILIGRELGLGLAASLEAFHIVQDRPFAKAVTLRALAEKHPDCEWIMITHADDQSATIKTKHRRIPEVLEYTFTRERAEKAGYFTGANKFNWNSKTQEMLEARATSKAVRRWYPSSVLGMHSEEEARDD